jgi:hypothetical protein
MFPSLSYLNQDGISLALNIINFYKEYENRPDQQVKSLRYLYQHYNYLGYNISRETLFNTAMDVVQTFTNKNDVENLAEIIDVLLTFVPEHRERIMLLNQNIANDIEDRNQERKIAHEVKRNIVNKTVYQDGQNVHNSTVNKTVIKAAKKIFQLYSDRFMVMSEIRDQIKHENEIINNIGLELKQKYPKRTVLINESIEYFKDSIAIFSNINITLRQIFISVYFWILDHNNKSDLLDRLIEELKDMKSLCTTGHIARLINTIQGFTDDEELCIRINNQDQYKSVIKQYLDKCLSECKDENVIDGLLDKNKNYILFIRIKISEKLLELLDTYGKEIVDDIAKIVNEYAGTKVFE